jgi:hypothetical protein
MLMLGEIPMHQLMILAVAGLIAAAGPLSAQSIEYPTVAAAMSALKAKPGVKFSNNDGWTIAQDTGDVLWSFTPATHFANPAVGRRSLHQQDGRFVVRTEILCQAQKAACDRLKADYDLLDKRMMEAINKRK